MPEEEKLEALTIMTDHYHGGGTLPVNQAAVARTKVLKLVVEQDDWKAPGSKAMSP